MEDMLTVSLRFVEHWPHLLNFIIGFFNLPEKSVIIYPDFSNFNF